MIRRRRHDGLMLFRTARILRARERRCECADMSAQDARGPEDDEVPSLQRDMV